MPSRDEPVGTKLRVLLVDDNEDNAEVLSMLLELEGYVVLTVTAQDVVRGFATFQPHAALIDLRMPLFSGFDVIQAITSTFGDDTACRFVAMSGLSGQMVVNECRDAGFDAYLLKPFTIEDCQHALEAPASSFFAVSCLGQLG